MITTILLFALSFSASSLYIRDSAVTTQEVQAGADGSVVQSEEKTLGRVKNLKFIKSSRGTVTLSWDKVKDAYAYKVFIKYENDKKFKYSYTVKGNEVTIKDIDNEGGLRFKVRAFCYDKVYHL